MPFEWTCVDGKISCDPALRIGPASWSKTSAFRPDLVDRPRVGVGRIAVLHHGRQGRVVHDEQPAHGVRPHAARQVVPLLVLDGRNVAVLGQPGLHHTEHAPPVRGLGRDLEGRGRQDEIRLADLPLVHVDERGRRRHVRRVAARRPAVDPRRDGRDLGVAQRPVVLEPLNADVLLDVPGRHDPHAIAQAGPLLDRARPGTDVLVADERHRGERVGTVALLAAPLQNRRDVPGERGRLHRLGDCGERPDETDHRHQHAGQPAGNTHSVM